MSRPEHDVTYYVKFPEENCREDYIGETERRLSECEIHHSGRDKNSHVLRHCIEKEHKLPSLENFVILGTNYKKDKFRKKKSQYIKEKRSSLNTQGKSVPHKTV